MAINNNNELIAITVADVVVVVVHWPSETGEMTTWDLPLAKIITSLVRMQLQRQKSAVAIYSAN